jgi:hypothetical protein
MILARANVEPFFLPQGTRFGSLFGLIATLLIGFDPKLRNKAGAITRQCLMMPFEHIWSIKKNPLKNSFAELSERNYTLLSSPIGEPFI